ncbi:lipid-A-disaccharide synthase [Desulfococcaceae bacterium HSG8]|nr:lipid-A-disaccharide synthase [Desulfococcaceae bacterium HSG8]
MADSRCVMIIAGEPSGDIHGAKLVRAMKRRTPSLFFCGIGGDSLRDAGVKIVVDASELSVVGITEVFSKIPGIFKGMSAAKKLMRILRPDLLILIDFPDFNLHLAATAKRLAIPVLYYISPQIWAWRSGRVKKIARRVDHMAVILPFEADFYRKHRVPVTFVGHPLLDTKPVSPAPVSCPVRIGFLPGSREGEIARHLPVMLDAARILSRHYKEISFTISLAPSVDKKFVEDMVSQSPVPISLVSGAEEIFKQSTLVVAASGTVSLEAAIAGVPMVVIYKVSPVSYRIGRALIQVEHISLVNLIAGKEIIPELIQDEASPENIAEAVSEILRNPGGLEKLRKELLGIKHMLGMPGASERVADIAAGML